MRVLYSTLLSLCLLLPFNASGSTDSLYSLNYEDLDNQKVELSQYEGKVIFLNFWATWCPPCIKEMPSMQRLRDHFADQPFEIVAVNMGEDPTSVSSFMLELDTELTFPIVLDTQGKSYGDLGLRGLPMTIIYDHEGNIVDKILGGRDWDADDALKYIGNLVEKVPSN